MAIQSLDSQSAYRSHLRLQETHHFKGSRGNDEVVDDVVDLGNQRQDGGLCGERNGHVRAAAHSLDRAGPWLTHRTHCSSYGSAQTLLNGAHVLNNFNPTPRQLQKKKVQKIHASCHLEQTSTNLRISYERIIDENLEDSTHVLSDLVFCTGASAYIPTIETVKAYLPALFV